MLIIVVTVKLDVFGMLIVLAVSLSLIVLVSITLVGGIRITSIDGDKLKTE